MQFRVRIGHSDVTLDIEPSRGSEFRVFVDGQTVVADLSRVGVDQVYTLLLDGKSYQFHVQEEDGEVVIVIDGQLYPARVQRGDHVAVAPPAFPEAVRREQQLTAPMPGLIVQVQVSVGDKVDRATPLIIIESMKMNNQLRAQAGGTVKAVNVHQGQRVERGQVLIVLD